MNPTPSPCPLLGARTALQLWKLVLATSLVWLAVGMPTRWLLARAAALCASLPSAAAVLPAGEAVLILRRGLDEVGGPLLFSVAAALVLGWAWTVLWHGGVVATSIWRRGERIPLTEILGLGFSWWWRYARLALTSAVVAALLGAALWTMVVSGLSAAYLDMAERAMVRWLWVGFSLSSVLVLGIWAVTLRAAWWLGRPESPSVLGAWLQGVVGTARRPLSTLATVGCWAVLLLVFSFAPLGLGMAAPALRGGWAGDGVAVAALLLQAWAAVALFASFAPVNGMAAAAEDG